MKAAQFTNHTKDSDWENLSRRWTIKAYAHFFKAHFGESAWKAKRDRSRRPSYLTRVDFVRKIGDRKQRKDTGKYSFCK